MNNQAMTPRDIADQIKRYDGPAREMFCRATLITLAEMNDWLNKPETNPDLTDKALSWLRGEYGLTSAGVYVRMPKGEMLEAGVRAAPFAGGDKTYAPGQGGSGFKHVAAKNHGKDLPTDREAALKAKHHREQQEEIAARKKTNKPVPLGGALWGRKGAA